MTLYLHSIGVAHPHEVVTNPFIEKLDIGTNEQWILEKIGIEKRRTSLPLDYIEKTKNGDVQRAREVRSATPVSLGVTAAREALERAKITPSQVGLVILNCCAPDASSPTPAQQIAAELGITGAAYDVFTACPAFALHLDYLAAFREEELPEYILCLSTATLTQCVNYSDRSDSAIWGDGAAAWVVSARHPGKLKVVTTHFNADPTRAGAVVVDTYGHFHQDGRAVRDFSVRQTVRLIKALEESHHLDWSRDIFIGHQANATMLRQITENREIPESNHWHNAETKGNQAAAGAPVSLYEHWHEITPGQRIVVAVVGAGLSWGSVLLESQ